MKEKFAVGAPLVAVKRLEVAGNVAPPSVDLRMPVPLTAASTVVVGDAVSRCRSVMKPPSTGLPLLKLGMLLPKFMPPSIERNSPVVVATSKTPGVGSAMRTIDLLFRTDAPAPVQVSPESIDLYRPTPFEKTPPPSKGLPVPA